MPEWISVKDRLPEGYDTYLVLVHGKPNKHITLFEAYELAEYLPSDGWYIETYPDWDEPIITHWMPLPEPPKEDDLHEF